MTRRGLLLALIGLVIADFQCIMSLGPVDNAVFVYDDFTEMNGDDYVSENLDDILPEDMQTQRIVSDMTEVTNNNEVTAVHEMENTSNGNKAGNGATSTTNQPTEQVPTTRPPYQEIPCFFLPCDKMDEVVEKIRDKIRDKVKGEWIFGHGQSAMELKKNMLRPIPNAFWGLARAMTTRDDRS